MITTTGCCKPDPRLGKLRIVSDGEVYRVEIYSILPLGKEGQCEWGQLKGTCEYDTLEFAMWVVENYQRNINGSKNRQDKKWTVVKEY